MIKKDDKDGIIKRLTETLQKVKAKLDKNCYKHNYNDFEMIVNCVTSDIVYEVIDYIDHRLMDVTF